MLILLLAQIDSEEWNKAQGETVLRTWEEESNHDYENNQDISKVILYSAHLLIAFSRD